MGFLRRTYRARPIPELLDGENWEVRNSNDVSRAYVDFDKREFVVPFEESPAGELTRAHEAMHVKISPRDYVRPDDMGFTTLQSVEDCRVWQGLRVCGIETNNKRARIFDDERLKEAFSSPQMQHPMKHAEALFATRGTAEEKACRELSDNRAVEIVDKLAEKYFNPDERNGKITSFEDAMQCAEELRQMIEEATPEMEMPEPDGDPRAEPGEEGDQNGNITYSWEPAPESPEQTSISNLTEEEKQEAKDMGLDHIPENEVTSFRYPNDFSDPGKLRPIEHPKLDHAIKFKMTDSVKMTPSDEGVIPVRMHRYATDMKLFSRKGRRRAGAAVLIDVSGSMSLSNEMILDIIKQCPASIVAIYSGFRTDGILRIVAENGRYNTDLKRGMGGANVVDIPALHWLAKRKEKKKLWISDGWITTKNENMAYEEEIRKLTNLMREKKIERVGNVRELLKSGKLIDHAFDDGHELGRGTK